MNYPMLQISKSFKWLIFTVRTYLLPAVMILVSSIEPITVAGHLMPEFDTASTFMPPACNSATDIGGIIFRDYDLDGIQDSGEPGFGTVDMIVTAYDINNAPALTSTVTLDGTYLLPSLASGSYRLEFSGLPSYLQESVFGSENGTAVQFHSQGECTANFAVHSPSQYCHGDPDLATTCFVNGSGVGGTDTGLVSFLNSASGIDPTLKSTDASVAQIGSAYGLAFQRASQTLYAGSYLKRHVGFARGPGHVMLIDYNSSPANFLGSFDLQGVAGIDVGSVCRQSATDGDPNNSCDPWGTTNSGDYTLPSLATTPNKDLDAFAKVGAMSFGDIDITEDDNELWLVNTFATHAYTPTVTPVIDQRSLIRVDISEPALVPTNGTPISDSLVVRYNLSTMPVTLQDGSISSFDGLCDTDNVGLMRPWALKFHNNLGYLGAVCDAWISQNQSDLAAYVFSFDPEDPAAGLTTVLSFPLNYDREYSGYFGRSSQADWQPWISRWSQITIVSGPIFQTNQPLLSDIEFSDDGSMEIAFRDRIADQASENNYQATPNTADNTAEIWSAGDILHACLNNGVFFLEDGNTGVNCQSTDDGTSSTIVSINKTIDGPSNAGEFFHADSFRDVDGGGHNEIVTGALAIRLGSGEVNSTVYDPIESTYRYRSQGIRWFNSTNGSVVKNFEIVSPNAPHFGKGSMLGDLEFMCAAAPIEIGNRVWLDVDGDGIQDPNEEPIAGITIQLLDSDGLTIIATAVTDSSGHYLFSSASGDDTSSLKYNLAITANTIGYTIRIDTTQSSLSGLTISPVGGDVGSNASNDSHDSDGAMNGDFAQAIVDTGVSGDNDHTIDFGFWAAPTAISLQNITTIDSIDKDLTLPLAIMVLLTTIGLGVVGQKLSKQIVQIRK